MEVYIENIINQINMWFSPPTMAEKGSNLVRRTKLLRGGIYQHLLAVDVKTS